MLTLTTYIYIRKEDGKCVHVNAGGGAIGKEYEHDDPQWQPPGDWPYKVKDWRSAGVPQGKAQGGVKEMKRHTWDNHNKMHFESPHKTFNRQCKLIDTGNQIGDVVYSNYVRPYHETECSGFINPPGHLQDWDLTKNIVANTLSRFSYIREGIRRLTHDTGGIIYNFHHWNGDRRIDDGFVLTTEHYDYKLIKVWYINRDWRAKAAVDEAIRYITN